MTNSPAASGARPVFLFRRKGTIAAALAASLAAAVAVAQAPPKAKATLSRTSVPAAGRQEAIVKVSAFGYYALTVASSQGTSLQLVDRMAGPGLQSGEAGTKDGRLDLFLDRGEYKLIALGHEKASGNARLEVNPYTELHAPQPPLLVELKPIDETLQDFQQASYWLQVDEARVVAIEAAGRNLADLRLWRDGTWRAPPRGPPRRGRPPSRSSRRRGTQCGCAASRRTSKPGCTWSPRTAAPASPGRRTRASIRCTCGSASRGSRRPGASG
jgi:hypothetical protein